MSAIFRTVQLSWNGQAYQVKATMQMLNRIENRVSLAALVRALSTDAPPLSHLAFVLGEFLREAGARVKDDEVYRELMTGDPHEVVAMRDAVFAAIFPEPKKKGDETTTERSS